MSGYVARQNNRTWILKLKQVQYIWKHECFNMHWDRQAQQHKPLTESHWMHIFTSKLRGDSQVCSLEASCFWHGCSSTRLKVKRGSKKGWEKMKRVGNFWFLTKCLEENPTLPHLEWKCCRWNIKFRTLKCWKIKGLNWIAWSQADWQGLSGNRTSSVSSLLTKFMNTSELLHLMMKLSAGSFCATLFVKVL